TGTEIQRLTDMLARQRAQTMQVYADPHAFAGYDYGRMLVLTDRTQSIVECWYWQVAYWIQEDIAETIIAMNAEARNVLEAPVKRLLGISFSTPNSLALARAGRAAMPGAPMGAPVISAPAHVGMDGTAAIALNPEWPQYVTTASTAFVSPTPTNRITNEDIDVIHFSFAVILRASSLMPFMSELSSEKTHTFRGFDGMGQPQEGLRNQITILGYTALPVDITADEALFFRYGDDALYRVNFICEYIFDRRGYDVIKPEAVKAQPAAVQGVSFEE
ncbi:MAG TPA: hypothetical protein VLH60_07005, partial [Sedimentisphaerales bacterium]|nr:hypothetical protein [Sedimentisphaerales bacterium]